VRTLASVLGLSRARVYALKKEKEISVKETEVNLRDEEILKLIHDLVRQYPFYGYRKITVILRYQRGYVVNRKRVYRLMKENQLTMAPSMSHKKLFRGIPFSHKTQAERSNELWGIDMTYIWCGEDGWAYMHAVIDHHDKELLGYHFSRSCSALGGVMALAEAAAKRQVENLEIRSDNGCHYGAKVFRDEIRRLGISHTRTMVNTPKGNSVVERLFRSLKEECVWQNQFKNFEEAKFAVDRWAKFYNQERPHQSLGYETPERFYQTQKSLRTAA
jgi:putative transposase